MVSQYSLTLAHPWHGISPGDNAPEVVNMFVEMVPTDTVKYEICKYTGHLRVDRPQKFSNSCPSLYGFVPQTVCQDEVANFTMERTGEKNIKGDNDALDICVLTERAINHGSIILSARPIGGFRLFDGGEADDKIIAVLENDAAYSGYHELSDVPPAIVDRLRHYFLTYKQSPDADSTAITISHVYGRSEAHEVIRRAMKDYSSFVKHLQLQQLQPEFKGEF
jgi:inorganic pyrophosphatase